MDFGGQLAGLELVGELVPVGQRCDAVADELGQHPGRLRGGGQWRAVRRAASRVGAVQGPPPAGVHDEAVEDRDALLSQQRGQGVR